jgi:hypothetical protein
MAIHVPRKDLAAAIMALKAGQVRFMLEGTVSVTPHAKAVGAREEGRHRQTSSNALVHTLIWRLSVACGISPRCKVFE